MVSRVALHTDTHIARGALLLDLGHHTLQQLAAPKIHRRIRPIDQRTRQVL